MYKLHYMKKLTLFTVLAFAVTVATVATLQSCSKVAKLLQYDIALQSGSVLVVIPPTSDTSATIAGTGTNSINVDSVIKAGTGNALGVSNITSVKITSVTLNLQNGTTANNFANFKSCYAQVSSNSNTTPYAINIANNPDQTSNTLTLPVDPNAELKGYLTGTQFNYAAGGILRRATTDTLKCVISFQFNVHVQG